MSETKKKLFDAIKDKNLPSSEHHGELERQMRLEEVKGMGTKSLEAQVSLAETPAEYREACVIELKKRMDARAAILNKNKES